MSKSVEMIADTYTFCPKCAARVDIGRMPVGSVLTCRLCQFEFVINRGKATAGAGQGSPRHKEKPTVDFSPSTDDDARTGHWPSPKLFFANTLTFPFRAPSLSPCISLIIGATTLVAAAKLAFWCFASDGDLLEKSIRVLLWNGLLFSFSFGGLVALLWSWAAAMWGLTILRDTSYGAETIDNWPRPLALEGLGEWAFVLCAAMLATLPGLVATPLWHWLGISRILGVAVTVPVLFPIILLATLETDSPTDPFSRAVWRSVLRNWLAWGAFYVISLGVAALLALAVLLCSRWLGTVGHVLSLGVAIALGWMIYCRLLGRLAGFCSGRLSGQG